MIRKLIWKRRWWVFGAVVAAAASAWSIHSPERVKVTVTYRGTPGWVPEEYKLAQHYQASRCIPILTCTFGIWSGTSYRSYSKYRTIKATPTGAAFEVDGASSFSLGAYTAWRTVLQGVPRTVEGNPRLFGSEGVGRAVRAGNGLVKSDYHILDVGGPPSISLDIAMVLPRTDITIDFDPILYTLFAELPRRGTWLAGGTRCAPHTELLMTLRVPRRLRYRTTHYPPARPGQPIPAATRPTEAFLADESHGMLLFTERPDRAEWEKTRSRIVQPENVRLVHDPEEKTVTLEVTEPPTKGDALDTKDLVAVIGTPSDDGRYFGIDCVRLKMESRGDPNPIIQTMFQVLPDDPDLSEVRCGAESHPRLHLSPDATHVIRYETRLKPEPIASDTIPLPKGPTEIFILDAASTEKLEERPLPKEWEALKRQAIRPEEVRLIHDPKAKTITVKLKGALKKDYALVAGTPSTDGRYFGIACARLRLPKTKPDD